MSQAAFRRGMKTRRRVLGDEWVDRAVKNTTAFNAEFQDLITRYVWDEIWNRKRLTHRERRMLVLAMTATQGRWEEFRLHLRAALASRDLAAEDVKEILLQAAVYCGVPTANTAFREAREEMAALASAPKAKRAKRSPRR